MFSRTKTKIHYNIKVMLGIPEDYSRKTYREIKAKGHQHLCCLYNFHGSGDTLFSDHSGKCGKRY